LQTNEYSNRSKHKVGKCRRGYCSRQRNV